MTSVRHYRVSCVARPAAIGPGAAELEDLVMALPDVLSRFYCASLPALMPLANEYDAPTAPTMQVCRVRPANSRIR